MIRFRFLKKFLRIITILLPCFCFTFVFSSDSFATSVNCSSVSVTSGNANFSSCDTSSLDSSSDWYYTFSFQLDDTSSQTNFISTITSKRSGCSDLELNYFSYSVNLRSLSRLNGYNFYFSDSFRSLNTFTPRAKCLSFAQGYSLVGSAFLSVSDEPFGSSFSPSGNFSITANGDYDISQYASVSVAVPPEVIQGDYHDDLTDIKHVIILVPAVALVIYFLYGIYRFLVGVF